MANANLSATLSGIDKNLKSSLDSVKDAANKAAMAFSTLDNEVDEAAQSMSKAATAAKVSGSNIRGLTKDTFTASNGVESLGDEFNQLSGVVAVNNSILSKNSRKLKNVGGSATVAQSQVSNLGKKSSTASLQVALLSEINDKLSSSSTKVAASTKAGAKGIDSMGDEASEATGQMLTAASAADFLSLKSSALSINFGAFTIALRNLTTQVPLLVATLGNLGGAFAGLATAVGGVGLGGLAASLGGMLAKAKENGANLNDLGSVMESLSTTSQELQERLLQAFMPVVEMEGAIQTFEGLLDGLVRTVSSVSNALATTFTIDVSGDESLQNLGTTISGIGDAFDENIDAINGAIGDLVLLLGDDLVSITETVLSALPGFFRRVAEVTEDMINIVATATESFGAFIDQATRLGREIAAGVAPVLNAFFGVLSQVIAGLEEFGAQNIASAAKVGVLLLAINRIAGIMGTLAKPIAGVAGQMIKLANTGGPLTSLKMTLSGISNVIHNLSPGIASLSEAFTYLLSPLSDAIPSISLFNSNLRDTISEKITAQRVGKGLISTFGSLGNQMMSAGSIAANIATQFGLPTTAMGIARASASSLRSGMLDLVSGIVKVPPAVVSAAGSFQTLGQAIKASMGIDIGKFASNFSKMYAIPGSGKIILDEDIINANPSGMLKIVRRRFISPFKSTLSSGLKNAVSNSASAISSGLANINAGLSMSGGKAARAATMFSLFGSVLKGQTGIMTAYKAVLSLNSDTIDNLTKKMVSYGGIVRTVGLLTNIQKQAMLGQITSGQALAGTINILKSSYASLTGSISRATAMQKLETLQTKAATVAKMALTASVHALYSSFVTLGSILAVLTGGFVVIIGVIGTAAAALGALGQSGQNAKDLIGGLATTLRNIGSKLMPAVVESGNMMMDVFTAIVTPVRALISGFRGIATELGMIDEGAESGGMLSMIDAAVTKISPLLDLVGDLALVFGSRLTQGIENSLGKVTNLLEDNQAKVEDVRNAIGEMVNRASSLIGPLTEFAQDVFGIIGPVFDNLISSVADMGQKIFEAFAGGGGGVMQFVSSLQSIQESIYSVVGPALDFLTSSFSLVYGAINVVINVIQGAVTILAGLLGFITDLFGAIFGSLMGTESGLSSLLGILAGGLSVLTGLVGGILSIMASVIDVFVSLGSIVGPILGSIFSGLMKVAKVIGDGILFLLSGFFSGIRDIAVGIKNIIDDIVGLWNNNIGGTELPVVGEIPKLGGGGEGSSGDGGGSSSGDGENEIGFSFEKPGIEESQLKAEDLKKGGGVAADVGARAKERVTGNMGSSGNVTVQEGDTRNVFNQTISADPEDEPQIGRIAEDAMAEANSFKRRQQGSQ